MTARRVGALLISVVLLGTLGSACSDETQQSARETADALGADAQRNAEQAGNELGAKAAEGQARVAAEDLRVRIKANAAAVTQGPRSIVAINESAAAVAGSPEIAGAVDADGDGLDDDGKVQVNVDGASACVTLPATGNDTTVTGGPC